MNINKLLQKKKITGEEVGKAVIASLCYTYKSMLQGKGEQTLFSNADLQRMLKSVDTREDITAYNRYIAFNRFIIRINPIVIAHEQFLDAVIHKLLGILGNANTNEDYLEQIAQMPTIMTQKQFNELAESRKEEYFKDDNGQEGYYNLFNILEYAITTLVNDYIANPKKKSPVKDILKKYQREPVTDERILAKYNEVMGNGYYTLADSGIRSDEVTAEEWQKLIKTDKMKELLEDAKSDYIMNRILNREHAIFNGMSEKEAEAEQNAEDIANGLFKRVIWHYYEEPPKDLSKYDILSTGDLFEYYPSIVGEYKNEDNAEAELAEQAKAFCTEFKEIVETVIADLDKNFFKQMLADIMSEDNVSSKDIAYKKSIFSETPFERWLTTLVKRRSLYNMGFYGMGFIDEDSYILDGNGFFKGVAILREGCERFNFNLDENGYYKQPEVYNLMGVSIGLEQFTEENPDYIEAYEKIEKDLNTVEEYIYYLQGINVAFDMAIDYTGIEELALFKTNVESFKARTEAINNLVVMLYNKIAKSNYQSEEKKQTKLEVIKNVFRPIKTDYEIPQENIEKAKAMIQDQLKAFATDNGVFEGLLTTLDRGLYDE